MILAAMAGARGGDRVLDGAHALQRADWDAARIAFESALDTADAPEVHEGLGLALWFLGRIPEGITQRERAFEGYVRTGHCDDAARVAVWVSHQHLLGGRTSAARGWLARAERSVEGLAAACPGRGWVAVERARHAQSAHEQITQAERAIEIGRASGDGDLEVFALSLLGRAVVSVGRREDGLLQLEEAMAAASSGRVRNMHTLAETYCNLIEGCATAGHWLQAEQALEAALASHARYIPQMSSATAATLAELRVRQGRLLDAERLLTGREEEPPSLRALALLRMAEGRPQAAAALLERGLRGTTDHVVRAAALLAPLVDARLDCGDAEGAAVAAAELSKIAGTTGIRLIQAHADLAAARVALAAACTADAAEPARRAVTAFSKLAMPFDAGEARLDLARALADQAPGVARDEARTALATFREFGGGTRPRSHAAGELTAREQEVLQLVALGMTNARIAATLVISEKTAGHHVSHILTKLGVHNRTEAASHADRTLRRHEPVSLTRPDAEAATRWGAPRG